MKRIVLATLTLALVTAAAAQQPKEKPKMSPARGTFEVKITPDPAGAEYGRMSIDKKFSGDLEGTSKGEMLSAFGSEKGSGAYVAIERVTGTLHGRRGTFVLHHRGVMTRGRQEHTVDVVPDSGTDELKGLAGRMTIVIEGGKHSYELAYSLEP